MHGYQLKLEARVPCDQRSYPHEEGLTYVLAESWTHMLPEHDPTLDRNKLDTTQVSISGRTGEESVPRHPVECDSTVRKKDRQRHVACR